MNDNLNKACGTLGVFLVIGLALAAYILTTAVGNYKKSDRYVSVRGLAEKEVAADLAIWPITFKMADNDLTILSQKIQKGRASIQQFLTDEGFVVSELSNSPVAITDLQTQTENEGKKPAFRYVASATVILRTAKVAQVKKTIERCDKLVQSGIALSNDYSNQPRFEFTNLNKIKPEMIEEANMNARKAADKFAKDSDSKIGGIRRAYQGLFEINDQDPTSPDIKIVRVVTTIDYYLE